MSMIMCHFGNMGKRVCGHLSACIVCSTFFSLSFSSECKKILKCIFNTMRKDNNTDIDIDLQNATCGTIQNY